jgi:CheY-like chemotaxis protein
VPYTLLLADDSVTIQRVIELTFADEDVTVVAVSDGDQAIERLESSPPDIVLADIGMPGKNGYEVAQYIRRSPKLSHIPVVLLTGAFEPVDQARANDAGCDGVLAKPFEPQLVIGRVKELLARGARAADHGAAAAARAEAAEFSYPPAAPPLATPATDSTWLPPAATRQPAPFLDAPVAESPTGPVPRAELNDYFDRLDAAFSTLSGAPAAATPPAAAVPEPSSTSREADIDWFGAQTPPASSTATWDLPVAAPTPAEPPLSYASLQPEAVFDLLEPGAPTATPFAHEIAPVDDPGIEDRVTGVPDERLAPIEESAPIEAVTSVQAGSAAATDSEHAAPVPVAAASLELPLPNPPPLPALADAFAALLAAEQGEAIGPSTGTWPASSAPAPAVTEAVVDDIVRRVLERLSDTVVRDAVADVASKVAERLVREEIERIKASIK